MAKGSSKKEEPKTSHLEDNARYKNIIEIIDQVNDGVVIIQDEKIKFANKTLESLLGYQREKIREVPYYHFLHPEERDRVTAIHRQRLAGQKVPQRYESALCDQKGRKIPVEFSASFITFQGRPAILGIIHDITDRKKLEAQLQEKALFLENLFENAPEAVALVDPSGVVLRINKEFQRVFGYSSSEIVGHKIDNFLAKGPTYQEAQTLTQETKRGEKVFLDTVRFKKDGTPVEVEILGSPIKKDGQVVAKYTVYRDITQIKQASRAIRASEERFRAIFEGSRDGIFIVDQTGHFLEVNQAACDLTGYSREELKQLTFCDLWEKPNKEVYQNLFRRIQQGASILTEEKIVRKDGVKIDVEFSNKRINLNGQIYMHSVARDISEWKRDKEKIKTALKEKEIMLREIHHRVKNNMQIIISLMRLHSRLIKDPLSLEYCQAIQNRIYSMSLIHDHFYQQPQLEKINLASYLKKLTDHLFFIFNKNEKQIKLTLEVEEIHLDLNRAIPFGLLAYEIISNALKHAFPGNKQGQLSIRMFRDGNKKIHLVIQDTGIGLPSEIDLEHPETMGLQLIQDLTKQLDGTLQVKTNGGTTIKVIV
ncbi:MAG: PAS domain S-box protein [Candidatus Aminicenantes bacterium]|nr:PAS domain S-box protein [Candidatus Aminicenantes bacterium]